MANKIFPVFIGSLFFQIIQLGCFPILIGQILVHQNVSKIVLGSVLAIPWLSVLLFGALVPALIRRLGSDITNVVGFVLTTIGIILIIANESLTMIVASTICIGAGLIIRWVNCDTLVIELSDKGSNGRAIGIHEALMGLGLALGPLLFTIATLDQVKIICLILALFGQISFLFAFRRLAETSPSERDPANAFEFFRLIAVALAAAFVAGFIESSATALFPIHFGSFGFSLSAAAILVSSFGFGGTLLQPSLGALADKKGYDFTQMLCALVILLSCIVLVVWPRHQTILFVTLFIFGGAVGGLNTLAVMQAGKILSNNKIPAAMTAIAMLYTLGGVIGPFLAASSIDFFSNFGMVALFAITSVFLIGFLGVHLHKAWRGNFDSSKN